MSVALTIGTFDTPHVGHAALIRRCEEIADEVVIGVNSDWFVKSYKGAAPVYSEDERMELMRNLSDDVRLNDGPGGDLIAQVKPDYLVIGNDWLARDYLAQIDMTVAEIQTLDLTLVFVPVTLGISTTDLRERLAREQEAHSG